MRFGERIGLSDDDLVNEWGKVARDLGQTLLFVQAGHDE
jgi:hypothetical protein